VGSTRIPSGLNGTVTPPQTPDTPDDPSSLENAKIVPSEATPETGSAERPSQKDDPDCTPVHPSKKEKTFVSLLNL